MLASTATWKGWPLSTSARSVQQAHTHPQLVSIVKTDATSVLLARGPTPLVRAADVKIAPLTQPTLSLSEEPSVTPALMAITPTEMMVPRHVKHVQLVGNRRGSLDHDRAQNAKMATSAVLE